MIQNIITNIQSQLIVNNFKNNEIEKISLIKRADRQQSCSIVEVGLLSSIIRREGIKSQLFDY